MAETREVRCSGKSYVVRRYDDGTVALLDPKGNLVAGWPETRALMGKPCDSLTHAQRAAAVEEIRRSTAKR